MSPAIDDVFEEVLVETFEGMAFASVCESEDQDWDDALQDAFWSTIELVKPGPARVTFVVSSDTAISVAEAVGGDDDPTPMEVSEIFGEIANTIGGRWLTLLDDGSGTELGLPKVGRGTPSLSGGAESRTYDLDDGRLLVLLERGDGREA